MMTSTHKLSRAIVYGIVVVALCMSSGESYGVFLSSIGFFLPGKKNSTELADSLQNPFLLLEENDTCAYEIMVRFPRFFDF